VLPDGSAAYERSVGTAARSLYNEAAAGAPFYLDKTPPYFLIVDEIVRALPEARIIVLWRNPLSVLASVVETVCGGRWRCEDLLAGPDLGEWRVLTEFIGFDFDLDSLRRFAATRLNGTMGDAVGSRAHSVHGGLDLAELVSNGLVRNRARARSGARSISPRPCRSGRGR
jgi:hypothetical protein